MTYCAAWKKNKKIFMIADSAASAEVDKLQTDISSFGEKHGKYRGYVVQEGMLKIYKVSDNIAVCYSGEQKYALEAIEHISNFHTIF